MSSSEPSPPSGAPKRWPLVVGAIGLAIAGAFGFLWAQERAVEPAEVTTYLSEHDEAAGSTATKIISAIVTYSPETVAEQAEEIRGLATGQFLEEYEELLAGGLDEVVSETAATSDGQIATGPDIAFISAERATAVARVVQEITTTGDGQDRTVFSVMRLGLVMEDGTWKADQLEILSQNSL